VIASGETGEAYRRTCAHGGDDGTTIPLIMLCFLVAGMFTCASVAASAAFLAQRDLAGLCDGAALAAANSFHRGGTASGSADGTLPLDEELVRSAVAKYQSRTTPADDTLSISSTTDGRTVTVVCHRTSRIPFGRVLGHPDGLERTAVAHARSPLS
jgi:Putative Flp pilus-assembly TadE/G-like